MISQNAFLLLAKIEYRSRFWSDIKTKRSCISILISIWSNVLNKEELRIHYAQLYSGDIPHAFTLSVFTAVLNCKESCRNEYCIS